MKQIFWLAVLLPLTLTAQQSSTGIYFEQNLNWQAIKGKAKSTGKYIFMDCSASWCRPCKMMEREIFPQEKVGNYLNGKFISIRVQMDTSKHDNEEVKRWYKDARAIMQQYKLTAFPTFLFFTPDGELVHRATGYKNVDDFMALAADAINPARQYYTLQSNYKQGEVADSSMAYLAYTANVLGDYSLARQVADKYMDRFQDKDLFTKDNIEFMRTFTQNSKDKGFSIFYNNTKKIDQVIGIAGYSQGLIDFIIAKEEIDPIMLPASKNGTTPNWSKIADNIRKKYNIQYANRTIIGAKIRWYQFKRQWSQYTKNLIAKLDMNKGNNLNGFALNNDAWAIFQYSTDRQELDKAIYWMEQLFEKKKNDANDPATIDTYANLLYKAGKVNEAIYWEEKALTLANEKKIEDYIKTFKDNLAKMRKSQPTWPMK